MKQNRGREKMAITYQEHSHSKEIGFDVDSDDNLIDNIAFIYLVMMKFTGDVNLAELIKGKIYHFKIRFAKWEHCSEAKAHCDRNITQNGAIEADYKGALDQADPGRRMALSMKSRAEVDS